MLLNFIWLLFGGQRMDFFSMLASTGLPEWVSTLFPILKIVFIVYIALAAIAMTVLILLQPSNSQGGITGITNTTETYYSHNKGATKEGRMKKATAWIAVSVVIVVILFFIVNSIVY